MNCGYAIATAVSLVKNELQLQYMYNSDLVLEKKLK